MGLFSSKKKTIVHTEVMRVIQDNQVPESAKAAVIKSIRNESDMVPILVQDLLDSIGTRAERMYEYAERNYPYGLPTSSLVTSIQGQDVVKQTVELVVGHPVTLDYCQRSNINTLHIGWQLLVEQYGYDAASNELTVLSAQKGYPVYLDDMIAVYTQATVDQADPGTLDQWGVSPRAGYTPRRPAMADGTLAGLVQTNPFQVDATAVDDRVEVTVIWQTAAGQPPQREVLSLPVTGYDEDADYYQVRYRWKEVLQAADPATGQVEIDRWHTGFWTYEVGSGGYPAVDNIESTNYGALGHYFPFVYLRLADQNMGTPDKVDTPEYQTSKRMLEYLNLDYQGLIDKVHENPDIKDVEQAMVIMAVSANDTNEISRHYLFDFFDLLYFNSVLPTEIDGPAGAYTDYTSRAGQAIVFQDTAFKFTLSYRGIGKRRIAGKIAKVGYHDSGVGERYTNAGYVLRNADGTTTEVTQQVKGKYQYWRRQINDNFYDEIVVYAPQLRYHIYGKHTYTGGAGDDCLLIPIDQALIDTLPLPKRETLYARSLHLVFNTKIVIKVKWYQSGIFKAFVVVAAIVITVITAGGASAVWAAVAAMTATELATAILINLIIAMAINYALKVVVKLVGPEAGFWIGLTAAVVSAAAGLGAFGELSKTEMLVAEHTLQASTSLAKASTDGYAEKIAGIQQDARDFSIWADQRTDELKAAQAELDLAVHINPFEMMALAPRTLLGEAPQDFYLRSVHAGNMGPLVFKGVDSFVDLSLTLPTFRDSLGGTYGLV